MPGSPQKEHQQQHELDQEERQLQRQQQLKHSGVPKPPPGVAQQYRKHVIF